MPIWKTFSTPSSIAEASYLLKDKTGSACIIAGGTDLLLDIQQNRWAPVDFMVDITGIPELIKIEIRDGYLFIGSAATMRQISNSPIVRKNAFSLYQACGMIGGPQVRNVATLGGNVAHGLPAADGTIGLLALDAQVEIAGLNGFRRVPIDQIFIGPGKTNLSGTDLITGFYMPVATSLQASAFGRVMRPQGVALPILNLSIWLEKKTEIAQKIRVAIGPSGPVPKRIKQVEDFLTGKSLSDINFDEVNDILTSSISFRTSPRRASAEYRYLICKSLIADVFKKAWDSTAE